MIKHKSKLLRFAQVFSSRSGGFFMACIGVLVQAFHTYFITLSLSSLEGWTKYFQAILMAFFLSAALLYFTIKASDAITDQAERYRKMVSRFATLEAFINLFYWGHHLVWLKWPNPDWVNMIIAIPMSIILPMVLKTYGFEIRIEEPEDEIDSSERISDTSELTQMIENININFNNKIIEIDTRINQELTQSNNNIKKLDEKLTALLNGKFDMTFEDKNSENVKVPVKFIDHSKNEEEIEHSHEYYEANGYPSGFEDSVMTEKELQDIKENEEEYINDHLEHLDSLTEHNSMEEEFSNKDQTEVWTPSMEDVEKIKENPGELDHQTDVEFQNRLLSTINKTIK